jgi:hypothetical protein
LIKFDTNAINDELIKVVRVIRNLLQSTRQRNETKYNTNIRINNFGNYWILLEQLFSGNIYRSLTNHSIINKGTQISESSIENETKKAQILITEDSLTNNALTTIEELDYFGGLIHILKPTELYNRYQEFLPLLKEIFSNKISSSLKIRAMIACGFKGVYIKNCRMGGMWYFGKNGNWSTILTNDNDEKENISTSIIELFRQYSQQQGTPESKLHTIIEHWLDKNSNDRSWKHYFIKHPEFTSRLNYYAWPNDYEIRLLGSEGSNPLVAYHISPFVLTICKKINDNQICEEKYCYLQYSGQSPLALKNGLTLTSTFDGWLIDGNITLLPDSLFEKYHIEKGLNILKEFDVRDRIELTIDFINDIAKL